MTESSAQEASCRAGLASKWSSEGSTRDPAWLCRERTEEGKTQEERERRGRRPRPLCRWPW